MFVSETYEVCDCIYYDAMSSDTHSRYTIDSDDTLEFDNDHLLFTRKENGGNYIDLRGQTISNYQGKTIEFKATVKCTSSNNGKIRARIAVNNSFSAGGTGDYVTEGNAIVTNVNVPSDATQINIRLETNSFTVGDTVEIKDWMVYPV